MKGIPLGRPVITLASVARYELSIRISPSEGPVVIGPGRPRQARSSAKTPREWKPFEENLEMEVFLKVSLDTHSPYDLQGGAERSRA